MAIAHADQPDAARLLSYADGKGLLQKWRVQKEEDVGGWKADVRLGPPGQPLLWWAGRSTDMQDALDKAIGFAIQYYDRPKFGA